MVSLDKNDPVNPVVIESESKDVGIQQKISNIFKNPELSTEVKEIKRKTIRDIRMEVEKGTPQDMEPVILKIISSNGAVKELNLKIADTEEELKTGLMFVKEMAEDAGMLFVLDKPQVNTMWMKNTLIPLDMIFINADKKIVKIHKNAIPHDLTPISTEFKVKYIIELNGGMTDKLGISIGDMLEYE